jgi:hypothetical protein
MLEPRRFESHVPGNQPEYFPSELSGVRVEWSHLDQESGEARKLAEREFVILVDRRENTSVADCEADPGA